MDLDLRGKVAVVTGAARGIGRGIAEVLAGEGARIVAVDVNVGRLRETVAALTESGGEALAVEADVGDPTAVDGMVRAIVERFGRIDVLVNNAGISRPKILLETPLDEWNLVLRTDLTGCFLCTCAVARHLIARGAPGRVVNISSIHGRIAKANMGSYNAAKAGVDMLTQQFAVELAPHGIAVNAVAPGTISTEINIPLYRGTSPADRALQATTLRRVPMDRFGQPEEVGRMVAFLCSEAAGYVTGTVHYVDGGYLAEGTPKG